MRSSKKNWNKETVLERRVMLNGDTSMGRFRDIFVPLNNRNDGGAMPDHNSGMTRGVFNW